MTALPLAACAGGQPGARTITRGVASLTPGRNYALSIGSWGFACYVDPSSPGDAVAAFSGDMAAAFTW